MLQYFIKTLPLKNVRNVGLSSKEVSRTLEFRFKNCRAPGYYGVTSELQRIEIRETSRAPRKKKGLQGSKALSLGPFWTLLGFCQSNIHVVLITTFSFKKIWHITSQQTSQALIPMVVALPVVVEQWMETATQTIMLVEHVHTLLIKIMLGGELTWGKRSL